MKFKNNKNSRPREILEFEEYYFSNVQKIIHRMEKLQQNNDTIWGMLKQPSPQSYL